MCPSYMATRNEKDTTRARANILREILTRPKNVRQPWNSPEVKEVMDLCLSCKRLQIRMSVQRRRRPAQGRNG